MKKQDYLNFYKETLEENKLKKNMRTIKITIELDGQEVTRNYNCDGEGSFNWMDSEWGERINDMIKTLEESKIETF